MATVPQQNWTIDEQLTKRENAEWVRALSPQQRFAIYADLFDVI